MTEWTRLPIPNEQYEVTGNGRIRHAISLREKSPTLGKNGYFVVNLWSKNVGHVEYMHALVASAFIGPRLENSVVNHIDGNKKNNHRSNLEYVTLAENTLHAMRVGLTKTHGAFNAHAKLSDSDVSQIRSRIKSGEKQSEIAREFNLSPSTISQIKSGQRWKHLPV